MMAVGFANGDPCPFMGQFLKSMNFEAHNGIGEAVFTDNIAEAMTFEDQIALFEYWKTVPQCRPLRPDGKPNRPLTCTSIMTVKVPKCRTN